jgi:hypothetical protein
MPRKVTCDPAPLPRTAAQTAMYPVSRDLLQIRSPLYSGIQDTSLNVRSRYEHLRTNATRNAAVTLIALVFGFFSSPMLSAEELVRRPATVIRFQPETIGKVTFQWINLRIEPKARTRDAKPFEAKLDTTCTKIVFVSATGRRRPAARVELKPDMRVLVSGWTSISGVPTATDIQIIDATQ